MLTRGAVQQMVNNVTNIRPRLQILDAKKIVTGRQQEERCRLVLSDGDHYIQGMLAQQCHHMLASGALKKFAVIQLREFVCNVVGGKKICVVVDCEVTAQQNATIGAPQNIMNPSAGPKFGGNQNRPAPPQNQQAFHQRNQGQGFGQNQSGSNYGGGNNDNNRYGGGGGNNQNKSRCGGNDNFQPVSSLNPYQSSWRIKVRVTKKDTMRHWSNQKGDGKLFGLDLLDAEGTEIRAVCFNDAAEKFYSVFEKDRVYIIGKGSVRMARKGFSHIQNDYSITLNTDSEVVLVTDGQIMGQKYRFTKVRDIERVEARSFVDVVGVVVAVGPLSTILSSKSQKEIKRRNLTVADETAKIDITLWSEDAEQFDESKVATNTVIAFKGAKVSDFGGKSLSASGLIAVSPDIPETEALTQWVQTQCGGDVLNQSMASLTMGRDGVSVNAPRLTFGEVKAQKLGEDTMGGMGGSQKKADYFNVAATITTISHSADKKPWYEANPDPNCPTAKNAKVQSMGDGTWRCEKNGKVYNSYTPRYILRFCTTDFSGNVWMTAFNEAAEQILGCPATEAERLLNTDPAAYDALFKRATFQKYVFKCKAKSDVYEDTSRVRYDAVAVQKVDPAMEAEKMMDKIQELMASRAGTGGAAANGQQMAY